MDDTLLCTIGSTIGVKFMKAFEVCDYPVINYNFTSTNTFLTIVENLDYCPPYSLIMWSLSYTEENEDILCFLQNLGWMDQNNQPNDNSFFLDLKEVYGISLRQQVIILYKFM